MEMTSSVTSSLVPPCASSAPSASVPSASEGNSDRQCGDLDALIHDISNILEPSEEKEPSRFYDTILGSVIAYKDTEFKSKEEPLSLLKEIQVMAELVKKCQESSHLKEKMQHEIKNATKFLYKGAIACREQTSKFGRFFRSTENKIELSHLRKELNKMYVHFKAETVARDFPTHAVGLEESVKEVIDILELETENRALAVVLHGVRGMGKTTLADAVFSKASFQGRKYSRIKLFDNRESIPIITDLQRLILKDLTGFRKIAEIRKPEEGQRELADILKKVPAFIYIDNVVREDELRQLLPEDLNSAKNLRLLITARNVIVGRAIPLNTRSIMYPMKGMSRERAVMLFNQKLFVDMIGKLNPDQLNHILNICDGNPLMLIKVAKALCFDEDKRNIFVLKSINRRFVVEGGKNKEKKLKDHRLHSGCD